VGVKEEYLMKRPLDSITIRGFKSIRELDNFRLLPINILIGANGAGKSNFISLFKLLNEIINHSLQAYILTDRSNIDEFLYFGQKVTKEIHLKLNFGANGYEISLSPSASESLIIIDELCWYKNETGEVKKFLLKSGVKESGLPKKIYDFPRNPKDFVKETISGWNIYHFQDTSDQARVKQSSEIDDNNFFRPDASNLAAFLFLLREKHFPYYQRIVETVRLVAPFFDDFQLNPSQRNEEKIRLEWKERGSDIYFNAHSLSDGTLRFICLATLLLQPSLPATILLDEPELGLHPYAITLLAGMLRSASTQTQVIVSTQSVSLVNEFQPEDIIVVDREEEQSVFRRLSSDGLTDWLEEYSLGELWEKNVIGGRP
jgi:predicted ATPase